MPRLALYQPDIPQNTGTILRLAACLAVPADIIEPAGFDVSDRNFRRAGLDYLDYADITRHASWKAFEEWRNKQGLRLVVATTKGALPYTDFAFARGDVILFGRESAGVPEEVHRAADARLVIPMRPGLRSINVAVAAAMILGEALRQTGAFPTYPLAGEAESREARPDEGGNGTSPERAPLPPPPGRRSRGDSTSPIKGEGERAAST
jgi:tRNA (cytidine/uridine-2'-O-)-methyltransferase